MTPADFGFSVVRRSDSLSYVAIAEECDKLLPGWEPAREVAFALNKILSQEFNNEVSECQEGIYEADILPKELENKLLSIGMKRNTVLDEAINVFIQEMF